MWLLVIMLNVRGLLYPWDEWTDFKAGRIGIFHNLVYNMLTTSLPEL